MILSLIQNILPATCLSLLCIYAVIGRKKAQGILFLIYLVLSAVCFALDSDILFNGPNDLERIISLAISILYAPILWCLFEASKNSESEFSLARSLGIVIPVVIFVACIIVVFLTPAVGFTQLASSSNYIVRLIISCFVFAELLFVLFYIVRDFVSKGKIGRCFYALFAGLIILTSVRVIPVNSLVLVIALNIVMTGLYIAITALFLKMELPSVVEIPSSQSSVAAPISDAPESADVKEEETEEEVEQAEEPVQVDNEPDYPAENVAPLSEAAENTLRTKFENYLIDGQKFLIPGITMGDVAKDLSTNRTYISQLVNQTYGMTFPEFLNNLRIDYAEQYILHNRNASQQEIAKACGFPSASSFNVTFKKITGVTPRIWLVTYSEKNQ